MVGIPARQVGARRKAEREADDFLAYGTPENIPDPVARALDGLLEQVTALKARVAELEAERGAGPAAPAPANGADAPEERKPCV